ncbi:MAG: protein kinase [Isosphaeraceae bacterium]
MSEPLDDEIDERFAESLAAFDRAFASGFDPSATLGPGIPPVVEPGSDDDLSGAVECLRMLEALWPRSETDTRHDRPPTALAFHPSDSTLPSHLGRFEIIRRLGGGGGGVVFLATDPVLKRKVALKVPRPEALLTPSLRERFLREAQSAARLNHPHLVPVYEGGAAGPVHYIASAYCEGTTLSAWLKGRTSLPNPKAAAELIANLADAIEHAHQNNVLHRDIKPSNILLVPRAAGPSDSIPDLGGPLEDMYPLLTDFGLARVDDAPGPTRSGVILGTPLYMSPEQARARQSEVGPQSDVYSLGVVLYELLTKRPPFQGESDIEVLNKVIEREPVSTRTIRPEVPLDLDAICLMCLEKSPGARYRTAGELAEDLRRFLNDAPTVAHPISRARRTYRWARRNPLVAGLIALAFLSLAGLWASSIVYFALARAANAELQRSYDRERHFSNEMRVQKTLADQRGVLLERHLAANAVRAGQRELQEGHPGRAQEALSELDHLSFTGGDPRTFAWQYVWQACRSESAWLIGHRDPIYALATEPRSGLFASGGRDGTVILWDLATSRPRWVSNLLTHRIDVLHISPDGQAIVAGTGTWREPNELAVWETASGRLIARLTGATGSVEMAAFTQDLRMLIAGTRNEPGKTRRVVAWPLRPRETAPALAWSADSSCTARVWPDGGLVATSAPDGTILLRDAVDGRVVQSLAAEPIEVGALAFAPTYRELHVARQDGQIETWDILRGERLATFPGRIEGVTFLAVSPDGATLAAAQEEGILGLLDLRSGRTRAWIGPVVARRSQLAFSFDSRRFAALTSEGPAGLWNVADGSLIRAFGDSEARPHTLAFTPTDDALALGSESPYLRLADLSGRRPPPQIAGHPREVWWLAFSPDGTILATGSDDKTIRLWNRESGELLKTLKWHTSTVACVTFSPDGKTLLTTDLAGRVVLWDVATGRRRARLKNSDSRVRVASYAPDGSLIATSGSDHVIRLWDAQSLRLQRELRGHREPIRGLVFTPDSRTLISCSNDQTVRIWDLRSQNDPEVIIERDEVWGLAFAPDGTSFAVGTKAGTVSHYDMTTRERLRELNAHGDGVACVAFSNDDHTLATGGIDGTVKVWDLLAGQELLVLGRHAEKINTLAFASDGGVLASGSHDGAVRLWHAAGARTPPGATAPSVLTRTP